VADAYGLSECIEVAPRVSRSDARALQARASVLVAFDYPFPQAIVMKFFDYAQAKGEMLLLTEPGSALNRAARRIGVATVPPQDVEAIAGVITRAHTRWRQAAFREPNDALGVLSRDARCEEMRRLLESVQQRATSPSQ
jgi:hypothetical protein